MITSIKEIKNFKLNFGPQHPSAHGVLRLVIELQDETVLSADPQIGLLHRGTEKLFETKTISQNLPYFDRFDYVSMLSNEHVFSLAGETLLNIYVPLRAQQIRLLLTELTRLLNHLMALTTHALDIGALTPFLWAFEEREKLMEFYERISGTRMHANFIRVGGLATDLPINFLDDVYLFSKQFPTRIMELENLLTSNRIWKKRLKNIGVLNINASETLSVTGVLLRSTGTLYDLRCHCPYEIYELLMWKSAIGTYGDSFDRYLLRIFELKQSILIIFQLLNTICLGNIKTQTYKITNPSKILLKKSMECLIQHFHYYFSNIWLPRNNTYVSIEAPKGELGVFLVGNNSSIIFRCKVRAPGFYNLQTLNFLTKGHTLSDVVTIIGTQDIVFGEIDR